MAPPRFVPYAVPLGPLITSIEFRFSRSKASIVEKPLPFVTGISLKYKRNLSVPKGVRAPTPRMVIRLVFNAPESK